MSFREIQEFFAFRLRPWEDTLASGFTFERFDYEKVIWVAIESKARYHAHIIEKLIPRDS